MRYLKWLAMLLVTGTLYVQAGLTHAMPENGWWWNPAESGRGFFVERKGDTLFMAGYLYETRGRATWLVSGGKPSSPNSYTGRLLAVNGGQTLLGDYKVPTEVDAGEITLQFADATHGTLTWPGGSIPIQRQVWSTAESRFDPSGWWWNPNEGGSGYAVEVQGDMLVMAAFMYDEAGRPVWYLTHGKLTTPTHYEGTLQQFAGGQTQSGPYQEPTEGSIGSVMIDWASLDEATLTFSDEVPSGVSSAPKATRSISIQRQLGRAIPLDIAQFFAAVRLESNCPNATTCIYLQTFPNGATREMTLQVDPNRQYTPTLEEIARTPAGGAPVYAVNFASDTRTDGSTHVDLSYFVAKEGLPAGLAKKALASSPSAETRRIMQKARAADAGTSEGAGIHWEEIVKKGAEWSIGSILDYAAKHGLTPNSALGSVFEIASAMSDVAESLDISKQTNAWLAELDDLEKCAANPTNPVSKNDPDYSPGAIAKVQAARSELKEVAAIRFLNRMTETFAGNPVTAILSIGLVEGFQWSNQTLRDYSENTIMREARLAVVKCSKGWKVRNYTPVICSVAVPFTLKYFAYDWRYTFVPTSPTAGNMTYDEKEGVTRCNGGGPYTITPAGDGYLWLQTSTQGTCVNPNNSYPASSIGDFILEALTTDECG